MTSTLRRRRVLSRTVLKLLRAVAAVAPLGAVPWTAPVGAQSPAADRADSLGARLDTLTVSGGYDDLIGRAGSASEGSVTRAELRLRPIVREGELIESVPGMVVTQHSGEGKANQYFVRGFNLDHGTDFQTRLEGMPVNLPTHGHGQGWTDLNFIVPELVDHISYRLGVHHAEVGDFGSAGSAEFRLRLRLDGPLVASTAGAGGLARLVAARSATFAGGDLLLGGEAKAYDGAWEQPQELRKLSGIARYSRAAGASRLSLLALAYRNRWNAADQIPRRAVLAGDLGRLGQIDTSNGGASSRYSLSASVRRASGSFLQELDLFAIRSDLDLYSNFTYFLDDPVRGDQFNQVDRRTVLGANGKHSNRLVAFGVTHLVAIGAEARTDLIYGLELHRTRARARTATVRVDRVRQGSGAVFLEMESFWLPSLRSVLGGRVDGYLFSVASDRASNSGRRRAAIASPKGSLAWTPLRVLELYLSGGYGFHSNDARGTTISVDPATGEPAEPVDPLVRSRGGEAGLRIAPGAHVHATLTVWSLELASELLFVGDAGATEPSARSVRRGITLTSHYRPRPHLLLDADLSLARARLDVDSAADRIPGAVGRVFAGGIAWEPPRGASGSLRVRHLGAYPHLEDNSSRSAAATLLTAEAGYRFASRLRVEAQLLNAGDSRASDIEYLYRSRLPHEQAEGVNDVHFHAVEPRQLRVSVHWGH